MKVKCIKRYSDVKLKKIVEVGEILDVDDERAEHLIHEGVAEITKQKSQQVRRKDKVIRLSPYEARGEASYFLCPK